MRTIAASIGILAVVLFLALPNIAATDEEPAPSVPIPDIGQLTTDNLTMEVLGQGHTKSRPQTPDSVVSNEAGTIEALFSYRSYAPVVQFDLSWAGERVVGVTAPPKVGLGHEYAVTASIAADGTLEVMIEHERQYWWCGERYKRLNPASEGYCLLSTADRFWPDECLEASKDPEYLKLYKPGTGPACVSRTYYVD